MRGQYKYGNTEREEFKAALLELCRDNTIDDVDLAMTSLCLHDCDCLLEELGYGREDYEISGWEGDIWTQYYHMNADAPILAIRACGYTGDLNVYLSECNSEERTNVEVLLEIIYEKWGKD